jgi:hypothetical protein
MTAALRLGTGDALLIQLPRPLLESRLLLLVQARSSSNDWGSPDPRRSVGLAVAAALSDEAANNRQRPVPFPLRTTNRAANHQRPGGLVAAPVDCGVRLRGATDSSLLEG